MNQANTTERSFYSLRLYIVGENTRSRLALANLKEMCEERLKGRYQIDVIDLAKDPQMARKDKILAVPTLIRQEPSPQKRIVGDMSNKQKLLAGLEIEEDD
jgi:circadian clock protein KaiB